MIAYEEELELSKKSRKAYVFAEFNIKMKGMRSFT
jgi:hypothetical protein